MAAVKKLAILNLTGKLHPALEDFFAKRSVTVVDPLVNFEALDWTHILTKDVVDYKLLADTYQTINRDVKLISLSQVYDLQNFMMYNGKLVLNEVWLGNPMGSFILDKFLQEFTSMSLEESFPQFVEKGTFTVTNPFNTGEYLDQIVHHAFDSDVPALAIKTYFDHLLMYLANLKRREKASLPFEVSYGHFDGVFGVQLSLLTKGLMIEDVNSSLSSNISKQSEQYFLNVAVQAADFFDFTYLPEVTKTVITGLWTNDERITFENRGMLFSHQTIAAPPLPVQLVTTDGSSLPQLTTPAHQKIDDHSDRIPASEDEENEVVKIKGQEFTESLAEKIAGSIEPDQLQRIVSGEFEEDDLVQTINGSPEAKDDFVNRLKGKIEEEKGLFNVAGGGKLDLDKFALRVSTGLFDKEDKSPLVVKHREQLASTLKAGLFNFAQGLGKKPEDLTQEDLDKFKEQELPKLLQKGPEAYRLKGLKDQILKALQERFDLQSLNELPALLKDPEKGIIVRDILKDILQSSLDDQFELSGKSTLSAEEKEVLVRSLTQSLGDDEEDVRKIINAEKTRAIVGPDNSEKPSLRLQVLEKENARLLEESGSMKYKLATLLGEVRVLKASQKALEDISAQSKPGPEKDLGSVDEDLRNKILGQQPLGKDDFERLAHLMEQENLNKKLQHELNSKDVLLSRELEKSQRMMSLKDGALAKAKDALTKITMKREHEVGDLRARLEATTKALMTGPSQAQTQQLKQLEKEKVGLMRMVEIYKEKLSNLAAKMEVSKSNENEQREEARKFSLLNSQHKNLYDMTKRELERLKERQGSDGENLIALKQEKIRLDNELKKIMAAHNERCNAVEAKEEEIRSLKNNSVNMESQLKNANLKLKEYETKLLEALRNVKAGSATDESGKGKLGQLEGSVKKLTQDLLERNNQLAEMKKEVNKLKQEKMALQNQIDKAKKDADKASKNSPPRKAS